MKYLSKYFKLFIALFKKKELIVKEESNTEKLLRLKEEYYLMCNKIYKLDSELYYLKEERKILLEEIDPLETIYGSFPVFKEQQKIYNSHNTAQEYLLAEFNKNENKKKN